MGILATIQLEPADPFHRLVDLVAMIKGGEAEIPLARRAKTRPRRTDNMGLVEQVIEETPTIVALGCLQP